MRTGLVATCLVVFFCAQSTLAASFTTLPATIQYGDRGDNLLSDDGTTVVVQYNSGGTNIYRLGVLAQHINSLYGNLSDITPDGSVFVGNTGFSNPGQAFRFEGTSVHELPAISGYSYGWATGISHDGSVIVGRSMNMSPGAYEEQAFRWQAGVTQPLGFLPGQSSSRADAIAADGSAIVGTSGNQAFRWKDGEMTAVPSLAGMTSAWATGVSGNGSVAIGGCGNDGTVVAHTYRQEAFRSVNGMTLGLGISPGLEASVALSTTLDGSVIVGSQGTWIKPYSWSDYYYLDSTAMIWDSSHGLRDLKSVFENDYGLDLTGWILTSAWRISDDGSTICGYGRTTGYDGIWIATIPEPATVALFTLGAFIIGGRRKA